MLKNIVAKIREYFSKEFAICVDLDGTLLDGTHRHYLMFEKIKQSKEFTEQAVNDGLNRKLALLVKFIYRFTPIKILLLTGRDFKSQKSTLICLENHKVSYDKLYMRNIGDNREDFAFKKDFYLDNMKPKYNIILAFEDRPDVVKMWKELKVPCIHCISSNPESYERLAKVFYKEREDNDR